MCRIFNLLIASSVSTMIADPLCYQDMFVSQDKYQTSSLIPACIEFTYSNGVMKCNKSGFLGPYITEFVPPFLYSHICYSAILVNYSPVILYAAIIQVLYFPLNFILPAKYTWAVDPIWNPKNIISYLKIPKMLSSAFYYFTMILTFGVLSPVVMVPAMLAFFLEVLTYGYFVRRFLIICTRLREMNKETKFEENKGNEVLPPIYIKAKKVLSFDLDPETRRKDVVTCRYEGEYEIYLDSDKNLIHLSELELIVEQECADKNFGILLSLIHISEPTRPY